jgi:hypothetical protein
MQTQGVLARPLPRSAQFAATENSILAVAQLWCHEHRRQRKSLRDVCFTPESGHVQRASPRPLWAKSGHTTHLQRG